MWLSFAVAVGWGALFCLLPGYVAARCMGADRTAAFCVAPLVSFALYGVLAVVFGFLSIPCSPLSLVALPTVAIAALGLLARRLRKGADGTADAGSNGAAGKAAGSASGGTTSAPLVLSDALNAPCRASGPLSKLSVGSLALVLGVVVGAITCYAVFLGQLSTPDAYVENYDNAWHLWHIHDFFESQIHSSLAGGFYPSVYHSLGALVQAAATVSTPVAENAINVVLPALVYPASTVLLLATLFPESPRKLLLGTLFCLSIAFFPWRLMLFGPLYPNIAAYALMPAEAAVFVRLCSPEKVAGRLRWGALFVIGGIALVLTQPNAVFSTGVFLIPYCLYATRKAVAQTKLGQEKRWLPLCAEALVLLAIVGVWYALYRAPALHAVVSYPRATSNGPIRALKWVLALCFVTRRQQYLLGAIVIVGALTLLTRPKTRWVSCSYALLAGLYVVALGVGGELKHLLVGFWYSDPYRIAAMFCVFCVPVIADGLDALLLGARALLARVSKRGATGEGGTGDRRDRRDARSTRSSLRDGLRGGLALAPVEFALAVALLLVNCLPLSFIPHSVRSFAFDTIAIEFKGLYSRGPWRYLRDDEIAFLEQVRETVGEGELIINQPYDGSVFARSVYEVPTLYNNYGGGGRYDETLREHLAEVASNPEVQEALSELGVRYFLQLDQSGTNRGMNISSTGSVYDLGYTIKEWAGIDNVRDDTPGFTLLLSEGDMRLYRIEY